MEIDANYTISTFDNYFPYLNAVYEVIGKHAEKRIVDSDEVNQILLILNMNYLRYVNNTNRFFRIFFDNLPKYNDFLPFWDKQEKAMLKKIINDPLIDSGLFSHNTTSFDMLMEDIKKALKKIDPNIVKLMLTDELVDQAYNIVSSRASLISLKGYKVIHNELDYIQDDGNI